MTVTTSVQLPLFHPYSGMDLATALAERAGLYPDKPFIVWEPGPGGTARSWTYAEFEADTTRVAAGLAARGVQPGDPVMVLLENSPAFMMCLFACARLGAVAVNTNTRYTTDELRHAMSLTGPLAVVTHHRLLGKLTPLEDHITWVATIDDSRGTAEVLYGDPTQLPTRSPDPGAPLSIQFTSGTTSRPKAAMFTHANALWGGQVGSAHQDLRHDDIALVYAPLFHTGAFSWQTLSMFWVAGTIVLLPKFTASRFWDIARKHECTTTFTILPMIRLLLEQDVPEHNFRTWISGAELPEQEERYGVRIFSGWGMTEIVTQAICNTALLPAQPGAIGRVAPEYTIKVTRPDGTSVDVGEPGDLHVCGIRGLSLFAEYYADPEATAASFDDDGYFDTGDRVLLLPSGEVKFFSRAKDMIKVGGENVAAAEIERVIARVPGVVEAAVVAVPDAYWAEVPVAFVVLRQGADALTVHAAAIALCTDELADFKVPRAVHFIDELPTAAVGKIAKGKLRELAASMHTEESVRLLPTGKAAQQQ